MLRFKIKPEEKYFFSKLDDCFSQRSLGLDYDAGTDVSHLSRVYSRHGGLGILKLGQEISVHQCQTLFGLMSAATSIIQLGMLHMRPFQWWLKNKWFHPLLHAHYMEGGIASITTNVQHQTG